MAKENEQREHRGLIELLSEPDESLGDTTEAESLPTPAPTERTPRPPLFSLSSNRKPLREWSIYAIVLILMMLIATRGYFLTALVSDGSGIVLFIILIFIAMILKSFFDVHYVNAQVKLIIQQTRELETTNNIHVFLRGSQHSLLRKHIADLYRIYRRDVTIQQDNLIELMHARLRSRVRIVDLASSVMVTLGLVGTIVGLIAAAGGLADVVDNVGGDNSKLLSGMQQTIGGMGTAFFTTLIGAILGGVVLRILGHVVVSNIEFLVAYIAEIAEIYILPILRSAARAREESEDKSLANEVLPE